MAGSPEEKTALDWDNMVHIICNQADASGYIVPRHLCDLLMEMAVNYDDPDVLQKLTRVDALWKNR